MHPRRRTLIESKRYERERNALIPHTPLADAILTEIHDAISVRPEVGQETDQPGVYAAPTGSSPVMPSVVIYYTYNQDEVVLMSIRMADPEAEEWSNWFQ